MGHRKIKRKIQMMSILYFIRTNSDEHYHLSCKFQFSCIPLFATTWTAAGQASLSITNSWSLLKLVAIKSVMHPTMSSSVIPFAFCLEYFLALGSFLRSQFFITSIRWPKYWSFSFSISPSNEYSGLVSFRIDWLDLLAAQRTLKRLLQTTVQKHQFFSTQLSL